MATPLLDLAPELFTQIVDYLVPKAVEPKKTITRYRYEWKCMRPMVNLASVCRSMHQTLSPRVYHLVAEHLPLVFFWACEGGHTELVNRVSLSFTI